jgi:deoxyribodipyrimidine photo-lyase
MRAFSFARTHPALERYRAGKTGYPLVDAGIRELHATGWMHPHVRAVAASFLCFDLGVDWRIGRDEWDRWLIEDDPALASGNWQWVAGVGADMAQYPRIYNPEKQRRRYDPSGAYVRRWIPELANVPVGAWDSAVRDQPQLTLPLFEGDAYPRPIVDHEREARAFLERYRAYLSKKK